MNDDRISEFLRARGRAEPPVDLVPSILETLDRSTLHPSRFATFATAAVALGMAAVVLAFAVIFGQGMGQPVGSMPPSTFEPLGTPSPSAGASAAGPTTPASLPSSTPGFGASVFEDPDDCADDTVGYRVAFPDTWWWNEAFESDYGPRHACRYFAPAPFDVSTISREQPIPEGVAIHVDMIPPAGGLGQLGEVVSSEAVTVGGRSATREEQAYAPGGFLLPDERVYRYVINLPQDRRLVFSTDNQVGDYAENRLTLDRMMETLEVFQPGDTCGHPGPEFVCGQIVVVLAGETDEPIGEVVERNGGDPTTDIVERRDGVFTIAVPHGTEGDQVSLYRSDGAVGSAELRHLQADATE